MYYYNNDDNITRCFSGQIFKINMKSHGAQTIEYGIRKFLHIRFSYVLITICIIFFTLHLFISGPYLTDFKLKLILVYMYCYTI